MRRFWVAAFALLIAAGGGFFVYRAFSTTRTPSIQGVRLAAAAHVTPISVSERRHKAVSQAWLQKKLTHAARHGVSAGKAADAPDVLDVTCSANKMKVASTTVQAQRDGVHIKVDNTEGPSNITWVWHAEVSGDEGQFDGFIQGLNLGMTSVVFEIPPGPFYATCHAGTSPNDGFKPGGRLIYVVDPNGFWVGDRLACREPIRATGLGGISGLGRDPGQAVRKGVPGVLPSDDVIVAGYGIKADDAWVVVRRESQGMARFSVVRMGDSWGVHWGEACPGSGIGGA